MTPLMPLPNTEQVVATCVAVKSLRKRKPQTLIAKSQQKLTTNIHTLANEQNQPLLPRQLTIQALPTSLTELATVKHDGLIGMGFGFLASVASKMYV